MPVRDGPPCWPSCSEDEPLADGRPPLVTKTGRPGIVNIVQVITLLQVPRPTSKAGRDPQGAAKQASGAKQTRPSCLVPGLANIVPGRVNENVPRADSMRGDWAGPVLTSDNSPAWDRLTGMGYQLEPSIGESRLLRAASIATRLPRSFVIIRPQCEDGRVLE